MTVLAGPGDDPVSAAVEPEPPAAAQVFGPRIGLARSFVELLATDGVVRGLIGPREAGRLWTRHVLNCAAPVELIPADARVVDVGSGAGLPGIVLAIARPDCRLVLVEPLDRRVRFLIEAVDRLELSNCLVVRSRAQDAPPQARGADVVVSRAVAPVGRLAGWCAGLARPDGIVLALKGASAAEELERDRSEVAAAGLRDPSVVRVDGIAGTTYVVRAVRDGAVSRRSPRAKGGGRARGRGGSGPRGSSSTAGDAGRTR